MPSAEPALSSGPVGVDALALVALVFADFLDAFFEDVRFLAVAVEDAPAVAAPASAVDSALAESVPSGCAGSGLSLFDSAGFTGE